MAWAYLLGETMAKCFLEVVPYRSEGGMFFVATGLDDGERCEKSHSRTYFDVKVLYEELDAVGIRMDVINEVQLECLLLMAPLRLKATEHMLQLLGAWELYEQTDENL